VLSITPRLVRNIYRPEGEPLEFRSGTENSARERPVSTVQPRPEPAPVSASAPVPVPAQAQARAPVFAAARVSPAMTRQLVDEGRDAP
jgi:general secretion pathway protein D